MGSEMCIRDSLKCSIFNIRRDDMLRRRIRYKKALRTCPHCKIKCSCKCEKLPDQHVYWRGITAFKRPRQCECCGKSFATYEIAEEHLEEFRSTVLESSARYSRVLSAIIEAWNIIQVQFATISKLIAEAKELYPKSSQTEIVKRLGPRRPPPPRPPSSPPTV